MKYLAIFEEQRYIEVEIEANTLDAAIKQAESMAANSNAWPEHDFALGHDYDCVRIDYADPETGKDTEVNLI